MFACLLYSGGDSSYQYYLDLRNGVTSVSSQTITLGKNATENSDGTYTLKNTVTIAKKNWYNDYSKYKGYYICSDLTSTVCDNKIIVTSTSNYELHYDSTYNYLYGNDVSWDGTTYTLKDTFSSSYWTNDRLDVAKKYHYTCFNKTGKCSKVYYILNFYESDYIYYLILDDGKNIETAIDDMFSNVESSTIKNKIDSWYEVNMASYVEKLEDTPWCNDRTFSAGSLAGKDVDAGENYSYFSTYDRIHNTHNPSVVCSNQKRDGFTVSTGAGGNGSLNYPIGLLTIDEIMLAGGTESSNSNYYLYTGQPFFTMSPQEYLGLLAGYFVDSGGAISLYFNGSSGVRPAISLAPGTVYSSGNGTSSNPYVILTD